MNDVINTGLQPGQVAARGCGACLGWVVMCSTLLREMPFSVVVVRKFVCFVGPCVAVVPFCVFLRDAASPQTTNTNTKHSPPKFQKFRSNGSFVTVTHSVRSC